MASARITLELPATSLADGSDLDVRLAFDPADPYALAIECADGSWVVDRGLFLSSLAGPQGEGVVRLEPLDGFPPRLAVHLSGPMAPSSFSLPVEPVWGFLGEVWRTVPDGEEGLMMDVEEELRRMGGL